MSHPTADWGRVGDKYYRKIKLYEDVFDPELELENYIVAGAPYAGAIALFRDDSKVQAWQTRHSPKTGIDIYSCAGKLIRRLNWDKGTIKGLGWSEDEKLLVVTEDGIVRHYLDLQGEFSQFTLGNGAEEDGVKACKFWGTGFVALLNSNRLIAVTHYTNPRPKLLAAVSTEGKVHSWSVIPPQHSTSRSVEVLLAIGQSIFVVDSTEAEDRMLQNGPFHHISISPNGRFIALYTEDSKVWVVSSDFQEKLSEYDSKAKTIPRDVQWCGNDSVALAWEDEVHMVGPSGVSLKYYYDSWVHLLPDVDGVRLITGDVCEFIQKVPDETEEVLKLGSNAPAAILLDAVDQLEKKSPKADENIQLIKSNLKEAIDVCIRAAGQEHSIAWQKQLLKAASFGKSVLDFYNSDEFVNICETLRVLNGVRDYRIGLPLTYDQYLRLTPARLVQRLIDRHEYLLAIKISNYLRLPTERIYIHWACQKVRTSTEDQDTICNTVVKKLSDQKGISFEVIARAAYDEGRAQLATQLLNHEARAGKQVPLLLSMDEDNLALDKAIECGDTDLIFFVLLQMKSKLPLSSFFRMLSTRPLASALVEASAASNDRSLLKDLYYQDDRVISSSNLLFSDALSAASLGQAIDKLKIARSSLAESKDAGAATHQKHLQEAQQLLRAQEGLSRDLDISYSGTSLYETLHHLIRDGYGKRATKLQSDFHISDKMFAWIRLRALVAARNWGELEELAKARKSVIGWEGYFNEILAAGNTRLAGTFVAKCTNLTSQQRSEMLVKCGLIVDAAKELGKAKDLSGLEALREAHGNGADGVEIERIISSLSGGGRR